MVYIHNVPGRVRVISEAIKRNPQAANEVRKGLTTLAGVRTVHINLITGSILIHYDPKTLTSEDILEVLEMNGFLDRAKAISNDEYFRKGCSRVGATVMKTAIEIFIGRAMGNAPSSFLIFLL